MLFLLAAPCGAAAQGPPPEPAPGYSLQDEGALTLELTSASRGTAARAADLFQEVRQAVEARLGVPLPPRPHCILAATDAEFERRFQLLASRPPPSGCLAAAWADRGLVLVRASAIAEGTEAGLSRTLGHELAHLALGRVERERGRPLPLFLNEGLAEWASGRVLTAQETDLVGGWARFGGLPALCSLADELPDHGGARGRAYLIACAFVQWLDGAAEAGGVRRLVAALRAPPEGEVGAAEDEAFRLALGMPLLEAEVAWREELCREHSTFLALLRGLPFWSAFGLLALAAFARHAWVTRRLRRRLAEEDARGGASG